MDIKLTYPEFDALVNKRYVVPSCSKGEGIPLQVKEMVDFGGKEALLFSFVEKIGLNDAALRLQLNTLYGIPEGLFADVVGKEVENLGGQLDDAQWAVCDRIYLSLRRALLFMSVWIVKDYEEPILEGMQQKWFNRNMASHQPLLLELIRQLSLENDFPQQIPVHPSLESNQYHFQFNWLGLFLGKMLFNGKKMDEGCRNWLINLFDTPGAPVPAAFEPYGTVIKGYLLALAFSRQGEFKRLDMGKVALGMANGTKDGLEVVAMAYFFQGFFERKADRYYMTAGARKLMVWIERFAFGIAFGKEMPEGDFDALDAMRRAQLDKIDNCVSFYCSKNPAISNRPYYEFEKEPETDPLGKVVVLQPQDCKRFMALHQPMVSGERLVRDFLHITREAKVFENLQKWGADVLRIDTVKKKFSASALDVDLEKKMLFWDNVDLPVSWFAGERQTFESYVGCEPKRFCLVMVNDYKLENIFGSVLKHYLKRVKPEQLLVLNFTRGEVSYLEMVADTGGVKKRSAKKARSGTKAGGSALTPKTNGELQFYFENYFPGQQVRVITKQAGDECWEMVGLAIGALKRVDFSQVKIFDFRVRQDFEAEPLLMRFFRDAIVYDSKQRYFFLNL